MHTDDAMTFRPAIWRRWFAFTGGGIAWTFHLLSIYAIGEFGCVSGFDRNMYMGISGVAWLLIAVSIISMTPAVAATIVGFLDTRSDKKQGTQNRTDEGERYLSSFGWPLNALFVLIIFIESMPVFAYLKGC